MVSEDEQVIDYKVKGMTQFFLESDMFSDWNMEKKIGWLQYNTMTKVL